MGFTVSPDSVLAMTACCHQAGRQPSPSQDLGNLHCIGPLVFPVNSSGSQCARRKTCRRRPVLHDQGANDDWEAGVVPSARTAFGGCMGRPDAVLSPSGKVV